MVNRNRVVFITKRITLVIGGLSPYKICKTIDLEAFAAQKWMLFVGCCSLHAANEVANCQQDLFGQLAAPGSKVSWHSSRNQRLTCLGQDQTKGLLLDYSAGSSMKLGMVLAIMEPYGTLTLKVAVPTLLLQE